MLHKINLLQSQLMYLFIINIKSETPSKTYNQHSIWIKQNVFLKNKQVHKNNERNNGYLFLSK